MEILLQILAHHTCGYCHKRPEDPCLPNTYFGLSSLSLHPLLVPKNLLFLMQKLVLCFLRKKATDIWMQNAFNRLPQNRWQHITFTMPDVLWDIFSHNRHLINKVAPIAADIIKTQAKKQRFIPGIYLAIHTFGRDLKRNLHVHISTTSAGLSFDHKRWISTAYFDHQKLKDSWKYGIITLLREHYKDSEQPLVLPAKLKHLRNDSAFNSWLDVLYQKMGR